MEQPHHEELKLHDLAMGTGPWTLAALGLAGGEIKLVKNQNYWTGGCGLPFNSVVTKIVEEWASRKTGDFGRRCRHGLLSADEHTSTVDGNTDLQAIKDLPDLTIDAFFFNFNINADQRLYRQWRA